MAKFSSYQYIAAYSVLIVILVMITKTRVGYVTTYYLLALFALVITLVYSGRLTGLLAPLQ